MAIGTGDGIEKFGGVDKVSIASTSSLANNVMSAAAQCADWTNDEDAAYATAILEVAFATAPSSGSGITLIGRMADLGGDAARDMLDPSATWLHPYLGTFPVQNTTSTQYIPIEIQLPNTKTSQVYRFFLFNNGTGQTMSAGWDLWIATKALGGA